MISPRTGVCLLLGFTILLLAIGFLLPRIDLPSSYHQFADTRSWLGIPNFADVASNALFAVVGIWGLTFLASSASKRQFLDARERWPYAVIFLGLLLTASGSAYYHLAPDDARLVWDRLPMTLVFMALAAAMIAERISVKAGFWLLPILTAAGIASVAQWRLSVLHGHGDLRFYGAVQIYPVIVLLVAALLPPRYTGSFYLGLLVLFYAIAKVAELTDPEIFAIGHAVSGHTIKHLAAGVAGYWILRMLQKRRPIVTQ